MRARHVQHSVPQFPVYSAAFLSKNDLVLGGGGGASKTGIKNKLRLYTVNGTLTMKLEDEVELEKGEDAPMSMAGHPDGATILAGINSVEEKLQKGENDNCRIFVLNEERKIELLKAVSTLPASTEDDYQKVTVISQDGTLAAIAGSQDLTLLSLPALDRKSTRIDKGEIYDASFSPDSLVVTTTSNLLIYPLPSPVAKGKEKESSFSFSSPRTIDVPKLPGNAKGVFRSGRFHEIDPTIFYTVINTVPDRKVKGSQRKGYVARWNVKTWKVEALRSAGDKGITVFDVSPDGKWVALGSSDCSLRLLEAYTLSPLLSILKSHEFPPTVLKFSPDSSILVSGSADNTVRLVAVPDEIEGSQWGLRIMVALFALLFAILMQLALTNRIF
ncbi:unnamed protein product [Peniophora sp. CBMAI 1063]|nr:unnamed protein product [Peniophora sp. CBMAI 1063]